MHKQTVQVAIKRKNGIVTQIGRSSIFQPKTNFKGGSVKFYPDKPKQQESK